MSSLGTTRKLHRVRKKLFEEQGGLCLYCKIPCSLAKKGERNDKNNSFTIDHIVARKNGGTDRLNNLQGLCKKCNEDKDANNKYPIMKSAFEKSLRFHSTS